LLRCALGFTLPLLFGALLAGLLLIILALILARRLSLLLLCSTGVPCGLSLGVLVLICLVLIWLCLVLLITFLPTTTTPLRARNVGGSH
jgi:uncharacterized BrkB/YihY/UPF0761 family membrane protein